MAATMTAAWTGTGGVMTSRVRSTEARLDLATPAAGLVVRAAGGGDHLLGVDVGAPACRPADHWIRGVDLTAVYEPDDARRLRATAMWRVHPAAVAAWELVVSAQTSLLNADAGVAVVADLAGGDAEWTAVTAGGRWNPVPAATPLPPEAMGVLVRRGTTAVLVAVHPQDPRRIDVAIDDGRTRITCGLFRATIEKGVILRSRTLAALGPAADARRWASDLCVAFAASPPFLDT